MNFLSGFATALLFAMALWLYSLESLVFLFAGMIVGGLLVLRYFVEDICEKD